MVDVEYLGQVAVTAAVLPARVAYLTAEGSESGLRRAVQEASARWGGMTEPIIPIKAGGECDQWWREVARLSRVDQAINIDVAEADAHTAAKALELNVLPIDEIDRSGVGMYCSHPAAVGPPTVHDNPYVMSSEHGPLWEVVAAGDLTTEHLSILKPTELVVGRMGDFEIARAQVLGTTLINRSVLQFSEHSATNGPVNVSALIWVTQPDSYKDCLFFWNTRALQPLRLATAPMLLLPAGQLEHWPTFKDQLERILERPPAFKPDVILNSVTVPQDKLHELATSLNLQLATEKRMTAGYNFGGALVRGRLVI